MNTPTFPPKWHGAAALYILAINMERDGHDLKITQRLRSLSAEYFRKVEEIQRIEKYQDYIEKTK